MKVLLITGGMDSGGAETHVFELARGLAVRGHTVTVASAGGRLANALPAYGVAHVRLPLDKKTPIALVRSFRGLTRLVREGRFNIAHAHTRIAAAVADHVCRVAGISLITTLHARLRTDRLLHRLSRWGRAVIAVSHDLYRYLLIHCPDVQPANIHVIPNGIDTDRFCPTERAERRQRRVVFLSRLDRDCSAAAYALCGIAPRLAARYEGVEIVIGGGGDELTSVRNAARRANDGIGREVIRVVGEVKDTVSLLRGADVFVGVSRAAMEAMSCGVPTVLAGDEGFLGVADERALSVGEMSNLCCRGCEGIGDNSLLDAVSRILSMADAERKSFGARLREYVICRHSVSDTVRRTEEVYAKCRRMPKTGHRGVLLCGYYGYGNMGDELLLTSAVRRASERFPHLPLCALTARGKRDSRRYGIRCVKRTRPMALIREIGRARVVVFGGGTLLQNSTSRRSLRYYLFILNAARRHGKRIELWGNGVEDIAGKRDRLLTARALSACALVELRDRGSAIAVDRLLRDAGLPLPPMRVERDLALTFGSDDGDPASSRRLLYSLGIPEGRRIAVIAIKGTEKRGYIGCLEGWVRRLAAHGILPVFVVMYPAEDLRRCKRLCSETSGVLAYPASESDILGIMRCSELVCAMRYHALILASKAGTPFIGFGAQPKIQSFCASHGGVYFTDLTQ